MGVVVSCSVGDIVVVAIVGCGVIGANGTAAVGLGVVGAIVGCGVAGVSVAIVAVGCAVVGCAVMIVVATGMTVVASTVGIGVAATGAAVTTAPGVLGGLVGGSKMSPCNLRLGCGCRRFLFLVNSGGVRQTLPVMALSGAKELQGTQRFPKGQGAAPGLQGCPLCCMVAVQASSNWTRFNGWGWFQHRYSSLMLEHKTQNSL